MPNTVAISDVAQLVKTGNLAEAKRQAKTLIADADPHDLELIARCAHVLQTWPTIGVAKLRAYWRSANEHDRAVIAACAPENGEQCHHTEPANDRSPRWTTRNKYQAARDVRHEIRPELRRPARRPSIETPAVVAVYLHERAGVDDTPQPTESPTAYALDYDRAALPPLHGTPCVSCWVERATRDHGTDHDDGLCTECRERGRPGIPALPHDHTRAQAIEARCAFIASRYPQAAIRVLRRYWQQSTAGHDRDVVAAWVRTHDLTDTSAQATPVAPEATPGELARCSSCAEPRTVRDIRHVDADDGLCAQCRTVDSEPNEVETRVLVAVA